MSHEKILVIATAAHEGGALNILLQFLDSIPDLEKCNYVLFLSPKIKHLKLQFNYQCHYIDTSSWTKRIKYDFYKYAHTVRKLDLVLKGCINFQNVPIKLNNIPQIVYLHQSLPFYKYKWNFFNKDEFKLFLISKFYLNFIKFNIKFAGDYVIQSKWLAKSFNRKTQFPLCKIHVIRPGVFGAFQDKYENRSDFTHFLYPALSYKYKNHEVIVKALLKLGRNYLLTNKVKVYFTCDKFVWLEDDDYQKLDDILVFTGGLPPNDLFELYKKVGCILFPSKIESFGLPLVEAALMGKFIISSDLEYAREALSNYKNCGFVDPDEPDLWYVAFIEYLSKLNSLQYLVDDADYKYSDQWSELNLLINKRFI